MRKTVTALILIVCMLSSACVQAEGFALSWEVKNAILIDGETGEVLYEKEADVRIFPASTTKILTVYLGLLLGDPERTATVSQTAVRVPQDAVRIGLKTGEEVRFYDLLQATLVKSGNDGANVIAETISGSNEAFAKLMNDYVIGIGCTDTHFTNPSGLHDENHFTTARDMAKIAFEAVNMPEFAAMSAVGHYTLPATNASGERALQSQGRSFFYNKNSDFYYDGAFGLKTGYHAKAGYCFVAAAEREGKTLIAAVFGCYSYADCFRNAKRLLDYGFSEK